MARKNDRAQKKRLNRREKGAPRRLADPRIPRTSIEELVLPDGQCRLNRRRPKARFATKEKAQEALRQAQRTRARTGSAYVEKRVYACPEGGCGGFHLTSREEFEDKAPARHRNNPTTEDR